MDLNKKLFRRVNELKLVWVPCSSRGPGCYKSCFYFRRLKGRGRTCCLFIHVRWSVLNELDRKKILQWVGCETPCFSVNCPCFCCVVSLATVIVDLRVTKCLCCTGAFCSLLATHILFWLLWEPRTGLRAEPVGFYPVKCSALSLSAQFLHFQVFNWISNKEAFGCGLLV